MLVFEGRTVEELSRRPATSIKDLEVAGEEFGFILLF